MLFEIQHKTTGHPEFRAIPDALGVVGPLALQRLAAVIRILACGTPFDAVHDYTGVHEATTRKSTYAFCDWVAARYGHIHLGVWTPEAIDKELAINKERGLSGIIGSIDCTHWIWKNCPYPLQGEYHGRDGHRSITAEAIARSDMYFWHVFLGVPRSANDTHVLGVSSLTTKYLKPAALRKELFVGVVPYIC